MAGTDLKIPMGIFQIYNRVKFVKFIKAEEGFILSPSGGEDNEDLAP
jgi:hypothetical protein